MTVRAVGSYRIGPLPLLLFVPLLLVVVLLCLTRAVGSDVMSMLGVLAVGGYLCAWIGSVVPLLSRVGGPALVAAFLPSFLAYHGWIPTQVISSVTQFTRNSQFIYLYVTAIVVGSILALDRDVLLRGAVRILVPLFAGSLLACVLVPALAQTIHVPAGEALSMIVAPITGGGVGEGAIPLSSGYATILHGDAASYLARILPIVLMANMFAVIGGGAFKLLGQRRPTWTGNGRLYADPSHEQPAVNDAEISAVLLLAGVALGVILYLAGVVLQRFTALPAPVVMLLLAVLLRAVNAVPERLCMAARAAAKLAAVGVTHPLLFAVAVALTPWNAVQRAFHWQTVLLVLATVCILALSGFLLARLVGLHPIECALVNLCHTGSGGTGDVAILSAADRLGLMPFAQIATRIGGALTVSLALLMLRHASGGAR